MSLAPQPWSLAIGAVVEFPHLVGEIVAAPDEVPAPWSKILEAVLGGKIERDPEGRLSVGHVAHLAGMSSWTELDPMLAYPGTEAAAREWVRTANRVHEDARLRRAIDRAMVPNDDPGASFAELVRRELRVTEQRLTKGAGDLVDLETAEQRWLSGTMESLASGRPIEYPLGYRTDRWTGGLRPGELWALIASGGVGKTTLALQWARRQVAAGRSGIYLSAEMAPEALGRRQWHREAAVALEDRPTLQQLSSRSTVAGNEDPGKDRLLIARVPRMAPSRVRGLLEPRVHEDGIAWAIVDNLRQVAHGSPGRNEHERYEHAVIELRCIAVELGIPLLVLHHLNRQAQDADVPTLAHIRGSIAIVEESDVILALTRDDDGPARDPEDPCGSAKLWVLKARDGVRGYFERLNFNRLVQEYADA